MINTLLEVAEPIVAYQAESTLEDLGSKVAETVLAPSADTTVPAQQGQQSTSKEVAKCVGGICASYTTQAVLGPLFGGLAINLTTSYLTAPSYSLKEAARDSTAGAFGFLAGGAAAYMGLGSLVSPVVGGITTSYVRHKINRQFFPPTIPTGATVPLIPEDGKGKKASKKNKPVTFKYDQSVEIAKDLAAFKKKVQKSKQRSKQKQRVKRK